MTAFESEVKRVIQRMHPDYWEKMEYNEARKLGWIGSPKQWQQFCEFQEQMSPDQRRESEELLRKLRANIVKFLNANR